MANTRLYRTGDVVRITDLGPTDVNGIVTRTATYPDGVTVYSVTALDGTVYGRTLVDLRDALPAPAAELVAHVRTLVEGDHDPYGRLVVAYAMIMAKLSRTTVHAAPAPAPAKRDVTYSGDLLDVIETAVRERCNLWSATNPNAHPGSRYGHWAVRAASGLTYTITVEEE